MNPTTKLGLIGGLRIGLANLVWLYLAYYLGLHTNGIVVFQAFMLIWLGINIAAYLLVLRFAKTRDPTLTYLRGLRIGATASLASAVVAVVAQIGYYKVVHPAWPEYMAQQTREYFEAEGMPAAEVERRVEQSHETFTLTNYAIQSAVSAVILGVLLTGVIMVFLRADAVEPAAVA